MGTFTYWSLLGVPSGSNSDQIKMAFRREARLWHPDLNKNSRISEERFKAINEAYSVLSDPSRRLAWEAAGRPPFQMKEFPIDPIDEPSAPKRTETVKTSSAFNPAEKLLLALISIFFLLFINAYVM